MLMRRPLLAALTTAMLTGSLLVTGPAYAEDFADPIDTPRPEITSSEDAASGVSGEDSGSEPAATLEAPATPQPIEAEGADPAAEPRAEAQLTQGDLEFPITVPVVGTSRLSGPDRYVTALAVSSKYTGPVNAVFLATGTAFPDALSAASAAAMLGGPLLLTPSTELRGDVVAELKRLRPNRIFVIGGTGAVSAGVFEKLDAIAPAERLGGTDRYDTGRRIVSRLFAEAKPAEAFIATGTAFPDALAATGAAGKLGAPVILVDGARSSVPTATVQLLTKLGVTKVNLVGSPGAVSAGIQSQLSQTFVTARYGGPDRYETAAAINDAFFAPGSSDAIFLATGVNFPDALAGAALAGLVKAPLHVTTRDCVPERVRESIGALGSNAVVTLGGTSAVSPAAAGLTACLKASVPSVSGSVRYGSTISASVGTWSSGTSFAFQWFANGVAIGGATAQSFTIGAGQVKARLSVSVRGTKPGYTTVLLTSAQTAAVPVPGQVPPTNKTCPSWAPIKGNASSMIYHVPGGQFYNVTIPEACFSTEAAAKAAGYRKSKR